MENHTTAPSYKTSLRDRTLWFDGDSSFDPNNLLRVMQHYNVHYVDTINDVVKEFNKHCSKEQELVVKQSVRPLSFEWNLPEEYKSLNVKFYVLNKFVETTKDVASDEFDERSLRVIRELNMYESRGLFDVLRAIIFVINTLSASGTVWGVGRGSSVSSYVLYLIGVHDVDSFAYNLDIEDFLHD
jgi:DNA polymerase III alpha subunit